MKPPWYARRYPSLGDLEKYAEEMGAIVVSGPIGENALFVAGAAAEPPVIILPEVSPLRLCWLLAHELGHLAQHAGPRGQLLYTKDELAADRWAARALIPEAAVQRYRNASMDAFVAALWRHYEEFPMEDCPTRALAGRIARVRLDLLEVAS